MSDDNAYVASNMAAVIGIQVKIEGMKVANAIHLAKGHTDAIYNQKDFQIEADIIFGYANILMDFWRNQ